LNIETALLGYRLLSAYAA